MVRAVQFQQTAMDNISKQQLVRESARCGREKETKLHGCDRIVKIKLIRMAKEETLIGSIYKTAQPYTL